MSQSANTNTVGGKSLNFANYQLCKLSTEKYQEMQHV
jgi:hypothetical protein